MNILIAESGSTKTDWCHINHGKETRWSSSGLNPRTIPEDTLAQAIKVAVGKYESLETNEIYFYGAGCTELSTKNIITNIFQSIYGQNINTKIENDLQAAAHACFGEHAGIVGILGTGSTAGYFNGTQFENYTMSGGYLLGDEGSAYRIGQLLIKKMVRRELSKADQLVMESMIPCALDEILIKIYNAPKVNEYIGSYAPLIQKISKKERDVILRSIFTDFIEHRLKPIPTPNQTDVALVGSVAWNYKTFLTELMLTHGFRLSKVIQKPIDDLITYHKNKLKDERN